MHDREWQRILSKINFALSQSNIDEKNSARNLNIIDEIKEKLEERHTDIYIEWEINKFDVNYLFSFQNEYTSNLYTLLHISACYSLREVVNVLLAIEGINVNAVDDKYGATPLHLAAKSGHIGVVEILLKNEAKVNAVDGKYGITPLHWAARNSHIEVIGVLLAGNADVNAVDKNSATPLHVAAGIGRTEVVGVLLAGGAEVNTIDQHGVTPLHFAARSGHTAVVEILLENDAGVNVIDKNLSAPLHLAARNGYIEVVKILLENKANVDYVDRGKEAPLHLAARNGYAEVVNVLLENYANVNVVNEDEEAPLHLAARNGYIEIVRALLENDANTFLKDKNGQTPRDFTLNDDIKQLLARTERRQRLSSAIKGVTIGCLVAASQIVVVRTVISQYIVAMPIELIAFIIVAISLAASFVAYKIFKPSTKVDEMQTVEDIDIALEFL